VASTTLGVDKHSAGYTEPLPSKGSSMTRSCCPRPEALPATALPLPRPR
jgi:hypothetical protein